MHWQRCHSIYQLALVYEIMSSKTSVSDHGLELKKYVDLGLIYIVKRKPFVMVLQKGTWMKEKS